MLIGDDLDEGGNEPTAQEVEPVYSVALTRERATVLLPGGRLIPYRHEASGAHALPADYQALLAVVTAADGPGVQASLRAGRAEHRTRAGRGGAGQAQATGGTRLAAPHRDRRLHRAPLNDPPLRGATGSRASPRVSPAGLGGV